MRFSYVKYDEKAVADQVNAKMLCESLEAFISGLGTNHGLNRPTSLALTKLEEVYMWIGKAIRDEQIQRTGKCEEQKERGNE